MFLIISRTLFSKKSTVPAFSNITKQKTEMRKSPLFFNYKICTIQLPKFLLQKDTSSVSPNRCAERKTKRENRKEAQLIKRLPCVKGAVGASRLRDCFYNPSTTSWSPSPYTGEAKSEPVSATPASVLRTLANRTRLGEACKHAPHTCKSLTQGRLILIKPAPQAHLFSSIFSLIFYLKKPALEAGFFIKV